MGKFIYGTPSFAVDFDDRVLAHLKVVMLQFDFLGSKEPRLNRAWVEQLVQLSNTSGWPPVTPESESELTP